MYNWKVLPLPPQKFNLIGCGHGRIAASWYYVEFIYLKMGLWKSRCFPCHEVQLVYRTLLQNTPCVYHALVMILFFQILTSSLCTTSLNALEQLCPTGMADWAKNFDITLKQGRTLTEILMRTAHWMTYFDLSKLNLV